MFENEESMYVIQIPANVRTRMEIINGIGMKEVGQTCLALLITLPIAYIIYLIKGSFMFSFALCAAVTVLTFLCMMKDKYNQSIAIWVANIIKFFKAQRMFKFVLNEDDLIPEEVKLEEARKAQKHHKK